MKSLADIEADEYRTIYYEIDVKFYKFLSTGRYYNPQLSTRLLKYFSHNDIPYTSSDLPVKENDVMYRGYASAVNITVEETEVSRGAYSQGLMVFLPKVVNPNLIIPKRCVKKVY